jgi:hypothetical protein
MQLGLDAADPQAIAIWITQLELASPRGRLHGDPELVGDGVKIAQGQVDQGVRSSIAGVLRQVEVNSAPTHRDKGRHVWLETVLRQLLEAEAPVPLDRDRRVLDAKNRDDVFVRRGLSGLVTTASLWPANIGFLAPDDLGGLRTGRPMLPAEGRARLEVEQFTLMFVTPCPLVAMGGGALQDRQRAEVCPEIVTVGGEPRSHRLSPLRGAGVDVETDRRATLAAGCVDHRVGPWRSTDSALAFKGLRPTR